METFSALLALCAGNSLLTVNSSHKDLWRGALMFSLICAWTNDWVNTPGGGDLRRNLPHYDVIVMSYLDYIHSGFRIKSIWFDGRWLDGFVGVGGRGVD